MPMGAAGPSSTVAYSLLGAITAVEIARQGCVSMRAARTAVRFVEVLVVGDVEVGLAKQADCEACAEYAVDPQCGQHYRRGGDSQGFRSLITHPPLVWKHASERYRRAPKMAVSRGPSAVVGAHHKPVGLHHVCGRHRAQSSCHT
jgi:hypothetical protein